MDPHKGYLKKEIKVAKRWGGGVDLRGIRRKNMAKIYWMQVKVKDFFKKKINEMELERKLSGVVALP